jgi:tetratricopeptide (TPR) repeat protein
LEQLLPDLIHRAEMELVNQQWAEALDLFNQALALLNPGDDPGEVAEVYNGRGVALLELDRYGEAVKALETAVMLQPNMAGAYYNLGLSWEGLNQPETALHNYNRAIELEPRDAEAYFRRGGIWFALGQFEKTVEDTKKAIDLHEELAGAVATGSYIARGLALHQLQRYDEAIADYSKALQADPRGAVEAFFYRGLIFIEKGEGLPARADLQAYLTLTDDLHGILAEQAREILKELEKIK